MSAYIFICIHTYIGIQYNLNKKEILPFLIIWIELKNIMPSEITQA
jgi:hypothetical protein